MPLAHFFLSFRDYFKGIRGCPGVFLSLRSFGLSLCLLLEKLFGGDALLLYVGVWSVKDCSLAISA